MTDDQRIKKSKNQKINETIKTEEKQIQEQPLEIEAGEKEKSEVKSQKSEEKETKPEPELSPEEQKKLEEESKKKKAQEELEKIRAEFRPGDMIKVYTKVKEGDKERVQAFQGIVISKKGRGNSKTFMVRKIAIGGIGVEKIWPLYSPTIVKIKIVQKSKSRRAKLYYLRERVGKAAMQVKKGEEK